MKRMVPLLLMFFALIVAPAIGANPGSKIQEGRRATATLLATSRILDSVPPDGMRFLVIVVRKPDTTGDFILKEPRDFKLAGGSYQEKTKSELGKRFEPGTIFDSAEVFFAKHPEMRKLAPEDIKGAYILAIAIGGAKLVTGAKGEITVNVGFDQQVEPFTFQFAVPPDRPAPPTP